MDSRYLKKLLPDKLFHILTRGHERSVRAKKNILAMAVLKGINIIAGLLIVPLTLHYLNQSNYGIWLTISSIIGWFSFFDIGLGNGLRNKFAEAVAKNDFQKARIYISTTYAFLAIIIASVFLLFLIINNFLDWRRILNSPESDNYSVIVVATFAFFCLRFVFGLIGTVLTADQKPATNSAIEVGGNVLTLILIWLLIRFTEGSLFYLSLALGFSTTIIPVIASVWLYTGIYRQFRPSLAYVKKEYAYELMHLGFRFFVLQIGFIVIFSTANILITQLFSPAEVTPYNIAYKYFNIVPMAFSIILAPFWSAYTEAYIRGDIEWIKRTIIILKKVWVITAVIVIFMSLGADYFYRLWVGKDVAIPAVLSFIMGIYILMSAWCNIYVNFINGTGKIQLQFYTTVIISVLNIPLTIFLVKYCMLGIPGVILAPTLCLLPLCFIWPIQVNKILSGKAAGIWNR